MKEQAVSVMLIQSCIKQDRRAQNELYRLTYARLMQICRRYSTNSEDARELFTQGFLKILSNLEKYPAHIPFESWISRVMINSIIDGHRRQIKFKEHHRFTESGFLEYHSKAEYNLYEDKISSEEALQLLQKLPPATREVFVLFAIDEYGHREISQMLGISESTSKWHVADARHRLRKVLDKKTTIETIQYEAQKEKSIGWPFQEKAAGGAA